MTTKRLVPLLLGLSLFALCGCGDRLAEVSGTVTVNGKPLPEGVVTIFGENGASTAASVQNGSYTAVGVGYGNHRITVTPLAAAPVGGTSGGRPLKPGEVDPAAKNAPATPAQKPSVIPEKYRSVDTSGLTVKVDQAKVTNNITLD
jgi:hypothetical protein